MKLHHAKGPDGQRIRFSIDGTREELRGLRDRLNSILKMMDEHDAKLAATRSQSSNVERPAGEHYVDFGLDEVFELEELDIEEAPNADSH